MRDRIDKAADILRGYCCKVEFCSKCRFGTPDGDCTITAAPPCDWESSKQREPEKEERHG